MKKALLRVLHYLVHTPFSASSTERRMCKGKRKREVTMYKVTLTVREHVLTYICASLEDAMYLGAMISGGFECIKLKFDDAIDVLTSFSTNGAKLSLKLSEEYLETIRRGQGGESQ